MIINKDLRENKITYIDKGLWQHADNKECVKLIAKDNKGISNVLFNIIADSINLSNKAKALYNFILNCDEIKEGCNIISERQLRLTFETLENVSSMTVIRAVEELISKGVIKRTNNGLYLEINEGFDINKDLDCKDKKFIIIEVSNNFI